MTDEVSGPRSASNHDRLSGWKEIAAHLGKSVRTVQRWERELRLPVHRIHSAGGEIIFGFRSELDKWQVEVDHPSAQRIELNGRALEANSEKREESYAEGPLAAENQFPARTNGGASRAVRASSKFRWIALAAVVVASALLWAGWRIEARGRAERQPFAWRVANDTLHVFNSKNEQLWEHHFDFGVNEETYLKLPPYALQTVSISDLDGDGDKEFLFVADAVDNRERKLYCFNRDGSVRFALGPSQEMKFGDETFTPPYPVRGFELTQESSGTKSVWIVAVHNLWYPSIVEKVSSRGEILGEYWSDGHVETIQEGVSRGRRVMLVGATDNEQIAASLAVLDYGHPSGSAPSVNPNYRCRNCPEGSPLAFLVFPPMEIAKEMNTRPFINRIRTDPGGEFVVDVLESRFQFPKEPDPSFALAFYRLNPEFRVVKAETGDAYWQFHTVLELQKRFRHHFGPECEKQLFPVLSWDGTHFVATSASAVPQPPRDGVTALARK